MENNVCQSCGMPMNLPEDFGTNKDKSRNTDYCAYCYENGDFIEEVSMDEMIEKCVGFLNEFNKDSEEKLTKEEAISQMNQYFPTLKRWKN